MLLAVRISSYGCKKNYGLKKLQAFVLSKLPACIHDSIYATLGTRVFFSRAMGSFVSSAIGREEFGRRPKTRAAKSETAHEKPLAPRVGIRTLSINKLLNYLTGFRTASRPVSLSNYSAFDVFFFSGFMFMPSFYANL